MIAFAIHVVLPFFAVYSLPVPNSSVSAQFRDSPTSTQSSIPFSKKFIICTKHGFMLVANADLQANSDTKKSSLPKPNPVFKCPLCYAAAYGFKNLFFVSFFEFSKFIVISKFDTIDLRQFSLLDFFSIYIPPIRAPPH